MRESLGDSRGFAAGGFRRQILVDKYTQGKELQRLPDTPRVRFQGKSRAGRTALRF